MILKIYTDGGSKGNPGPSSIGGVGYIYPAKSEGRSGVDEKKVFEFKKSIGIATNNDAEYKALIEALKKIQNLKFETQNNSQNLNFQLIKRVEFYSDSRLMVNQVNGMFKVKNGKIKEYIFKIRSLEQEISLPISYHHIPREQNAEADRLVNTV